MDQSPELIRLLSSLFNTAVHLRTIAYNDVPERDIIIQDFNEIALITDNNNIHQKIRAHGRIIEKYLAGSNLKMKDGTQHHVLQLPKDIQANIDTLKSENKAALKELGIRLII
jgi:hypothetical protein